MALNVNGLSSKLHIGILQDYVQDADIACLSETKCHSLERDDFIPNFIPLYKEKTVKSHPYGAIHGLCVLVKSAIKKYVSRIENTTASTVMWLHVNLPSNNFILGAIYMPSESSIHFNRTLYDDVMNDMIELKAKFNLPIKMIGDTNGRTGNLADGNIAEENRWESELLPRDVLDHHQIPPRQNTDTVVNNSGRLLLEMCKSTGLAIVNGRHGRDAGTGKLTCKTGRGTSTIDYALVCRSTHHLITDFYVDCFDRCLSDVHSPIWLKLASYIPVPVENLGSKLHNEGETTTRVRWNPERKEDYKQASAEMDVNALRERIRNVQREDLTQDAMDSVYTDVSALLLRPAEDVQMVQKKKKRTTASNRQRKRKTYSAWFDARCQQEKWEYHRRKNHLKRVPGFQHEILLAQESKRYRNFMKKRSKEFLKLFRQKLKNTKTTNIKEYWNMLSAGQPHENTDGYPSLEEFCTHFAKLSTSENSDDGDGEQPTATEHEPDADEELNRPFTVEEIRAIIRFLKNNKASGIDHICNEFIKNAADDVIDVIAEFFNLVLQSGVVPTVWCTGIISPIPKKGSLKDPDNFRGITLLSCLGKLFTALINKRLQDFLDSNHPIGREQAGFKPGHSTTDHIFALYTIIDFFLSQKKRLYCCFIDYRKAFDVIDRALLWQRVIGHGIGGKVLIVLKNLYSGAKSCVRLKDEHSETFPCTIGVRQGENLSPLLFAIFLNDFDAYLQERYSGLPTLNENLSDLNDEEEINALLKIFSLLYADDTAVLAESAEDLQTGLDAVSDYCSYSKVTVNAKKTKVVIFSRGKLRIIPEFTYNGTRLEVVNEYLYLGIVFNYNGKFRLAINKRNQNANRAKFSLTAKAKRLKLTPGTVFELFNCTILPVLTYGCEVWGWENIEQLEVCHRNFIRSYLRLPKGTASCMVYGETGQTTLRYVVDLRMAMYWYRLVKSDKSKISSILYRMMLKRHEAATDYQSPWISHVKSYLDRLGLLHFWDDITSLPNKYRFEKILKTHARDVYEREWFAAINTCRSNPIYYLLNTDKRFEPKPHMELTHEHSILLTKLRTRSLNLSITRWNHYDDNRIPACVLCTSGEPADELHLLLECTALIDIRRRYIEKKHYDRPNMLKLKALLNTDTPKLQYKLAAFIKEVEKLERSAR